MLTKKNSLVKKELMSEGVLCSSLIIIGIIGLFLPTNLFSVIIASVVFVVEIILLIIFRKSNFEIWDETAKTHYATARRITIDTLIIILHIFILIFNFFKISMEINTYHIMIITGSIMLIQMLVFIILEKRV